MMQATETRKRLNLASTPWAGANRATHWYVLREPQMRAVLKVIADVLSPEPFSDAARSERSRDPVSRVGNFPPSAPQSRFATGSGKRCAVAGFPSPRERYHVIAELGVAVKQ